MSSTTECMKLICLPTRIAGDTFVRSTSCSCANLSIVYPQVSETMQPITRLGQILILQRVATLTPNCLAMVFVVDGWKSMAKPIQMKLYRSSPRHHSRYHKMAQLENLFPSEFEIGIVKGSCFKILQLTGFWDLLVTPQETLHLKMSCLIDILKAVTKRFLIEEIGSETAYQSTIRPICGSKSLTCSRRNNCKRTILGIYR